MPNTRLYYRTFNGGEISPQMTGRIDDVKFQSGAATLRNAIALPHGPAMRRPGTTLSAATKTNGVARLIPFQVGIQASYVVEIGQSYMRWHLQGSVMPPQTYAWRNKSGALESLDCFAANTAWVVSWNAHGMINGERVRITHPSLSASNLTADTDYYVVNASANSFNIAASKGGAAITDASAATLSGASGLVVYRRYDVGEAVLYSGTAYYCQLAHNADSVVGVPSALAATWYSMPSGIYEMPAPYAAADVFELRYVQSNDVMTIVHPKYAPRELRRIGDAEFRLSTVTFDGLVQPPTDLSVDPVYGERISIDQISVSQDHLDTLVTHFFTTGQSLYVSGLSPDGAVIPYKSCTFAAVGGVWVITLLGHQYVDNDAVHFVASVLPTNIQTSQPYYVRNSNTANGTFEVTSTFGGGTSVPSGAVTGTAVTVKRLNGPADGFYVTDQGTTSATNIIKIRDYETSVPWTTSEPHPWQPRDGFVQYALQTQDLSNSYQVTSVDAVNQESLPTAAVRVNNNLFAAGASNTLRWTPVSGATRYNVYKLQGSLYGYIGQTDQTPSLLRWAKWATAGTGSGVAWRISIASNWNDFTYIPHGFSDGDALKFVLVGAAAVLPTGISASAIYYVRVISTLVFEICLIEGGASLTTNTGIFGWTPGVYVGAQQLQRFVDDNIAPDMSQSPPLRDAGELVTAGKYPGAVTYYEQRRCFAGSTDEPQTIYMTRSNTESDLGYSIPSRDDDRIKFKVAAREANTILHMVPLGQLVMLTDSSEWRVTSVNSDALTPTSVSVQPQSYTGSSTVTPKVINNSLLFCASRGGHVRELVYNWQAQGFITGDLSQRANHLFDNLIVRDMAHQKAPYPVVWFVSSNGKLLGLTYVPEEQVSAWHQHDTAGTFESVCCIPEGNEDSVYVVVNRGTSAAPLRYVERISTSQWGALRDACYLDSSLVVDGRNTTATTMTVSGAAYTVGSTVTLVAAGQFQAPPVTSDVGDYVILEDAAGNEYPILITATASANSATGTLFVALPASLQATATTAWGWARNTFAGLSHLEGQQVYAFGGLISTTYSQGPFTVTSGSVTLTTPLYRGHIGLAYTTDIVTLPAAMQIDGFGQGRNKNIVNSWIKVEQTAGVRIGSDASSLVQADPYANPLLPTITTDEIAVQLTPTWQNKGQVLIRQTDPLPMTVIGLTLEASIGG